MTKVNFLYISNIILYDSNSSANNEQGSHSDQQQNETTVEQSEDDLVNGMVHEEKKHDNELDENEEVTGEQEQELGLGMVEVDYENEEHVTGEQLPLEMVNTDHDQNNDEQLAEEERTVQLEAVGNLDFIYSSVQSKLKYYHFIIP